jgi:hypothetical protein
VSKRRRKGAGRSRGEAPRRRGLGPTLAALDRAFFAPVPIVRLETLRILAPLAILAFMSIRAAHLGDWIGDAGFHLPDTGDRRRQPVYLSPLPMGAAYLVGVAMLTSALSTAAGFHARISAGVFSATLFYAALADRLSTFSVTKLGAILMLALALSPCGARYGVDAWRRRRARPDAPLPTHVSAPNFRFFQALLLCIYFGAGICKYHGDWITRNDVLWTHIHDSYQTWFTYFVATHLPPFGWTAFQWVTLVFEIGAPLWFILRVTRPAAVVVALGMHAMIGLMFGPVIWFSTLMMSLVVACWLPTRYLDRTIGRLPG